jgi:GNAT superfamily N-acetyltransferase
LERKFVDPCDRGKLGKLGGLICLNHTTHLSFRFRFALLSTSTKMSLSPPHQTRLARKYDAGWIISLSARVQADLAHKGSAQVIGPLALQEVESSIRRGHCFIFEHLRHDAVTKIGSVMIDKYSSNYRFEKEELDELPARKWFLHALMIEPEFQGHGMGKTFLRKVLRMMGQESEGVVLLDCFAGNEKLRELYASVGFVFLREVPEEDYMVAVFMYDLRWNNREEVSETTERTNESVTSFEEDLCTKPMAIRHSLPGQAETKEGTEIVKR